MQDRLTPANLLSATQRMFAGTPMRAILTTPTVQPGGEAALAAALGAPVKPTRVMPPGAPVSFGALPKFGPPAAIASRASVGDIGLEVVTLSNGVRLLLFASPAEAGKAYVSVRFGRGMQALPADRPTVAWAGGAALIASGIGPLDQDALDRLTSGRQITMSFDIGEDAFRLGAVTRAADLDDQLKLLAAKLAHPRWDAAPVLRARAAIAAGQRTISASPTAVLSRELGARLHGGDPRWTPPTAVQIDALTPQAFRALWEPLLATGPIEVSVFGDVDAEKAIAAVAASFGALPPRSSAPIAAASASSQSLAPHAGRVVLSHRGPDDQAAAALAWPTAGGITDVYESRKLDILAAIFNNRLFERLRERDGASYSPNVSSDWPGIMTGGGSFVVTAQLAPPKLDLFFTLSRAIATELASTPVTADDLARTVGPTLQQIARASSGNAFWLGQLGGAAVDPNRLRAVATLQSDFARITPADLQETARRWLPADKSVEIAVLPAR